MKILNVFIIFSLIFYPFHINASEPGTPTQGRITTIPWSGTLTSDVDPSVTHKVPFPGVLLDKEAWAVIVSQKEKFKKELELKELEKTKIVLEKDFVISNLRIENKFLEKTYKERIELKNNYIKTLENTVMESDNNIEWVPWAFLGGVLVGGLIAIGVAFGVNESK